MDLERLKLLVTIVNRGDGLALSRLYEENGVKLHVQIIAEGTASSELLSMLGLTHKEKDMLISFAPESTVETLLDKLNDDYRGILSVRGLAFTVRLTGISSAIAAALSQPPQHEGGHIVQNEKEYSLILVAVNQGYTDAVMQTAYKQGATGGTVVRGRWVGADHVEQFHGVTFQDEREVLAIACAKEKRNAIMDAVHAQHGLNTEQQAVVLSLPIERIVKLS